MTSATLPSSTGIVSAFGYDNADRLTSVSHVKNGSTTVASASYTLDAVGNRTQRVDQQGTHSYSYDNAHRLTSVTYPGPATTSYAFDAFGNRTSKTEPGSQTTTYAYNDGDRLTSVTPPGQSAISYTWDNNGDLTNRGNDSFAWDYEDRMTSATVGGVTTTFAYRGDGLRHSKTTGGNTTTFTWDVNAGLPVVLDDGKQYVYGAGLEAMVTVGGTYYYLADGLGSTMAMVDTSGTVQKSYTYDVYGKATPTGALANEFDFAGQQTDGSTGLQYLRARYMDPATGTFMSRDPMAAAAGWTSNPVSYVGANPVNASDPTGLLGAGGGPCELLTWCWVAKIPGVTALDPLPLGIDAAWEFHMMRLPGGFASLYRACLIYSDGERQCSAHTLAGWRESVQDAAPGPANSIKLVGEYGAILGMLRFSGGLDRLGRPHWSRHLENGGISREEAERAIAEDLSRKIAAGTLKPGVQNLDISIGGRQVRYTAYLHANGDVNVGRAVFVP